MCLGNSSLVSAILKGLLLHAPWPFLLSLVQHRSPLLKLEVLAVLRTLLGQNKF